MKDTVALLVAVAEIEIVKARQAPVVRLVAEGGLRGPRPLIDFEDVISKYARHPVR